MAQPFRQDMPPAGGFESIKYKRNLPFRGPSSLVLLGTVTGICAYGFYRLGKANLEKRELQREKVWSRIHLVPLLMAEGDRDMYRREQAALAREKEIMKDVKGWEPSRRVDLVIRLSLLLPLMRAPLFAFRLIQTRHSFNSLSVPLNTRLFRSRPSFPVPPMLSPTSRRPFSPDLSSPQYANATFDPSYKDPSPMLTFDDANAFSPSDSDQMLFGPVDFDDYIVSSPTQPSHNGWNPFSDMDTDTKLNYEYPASTPISDTFPCDISQSSPSTSSYYESVGSYGMSSVMRPSSPPDNGQFLSNWINDTEVSIASPSSPIPIPSSIPQSSNFSAFGDQQVPFPSTHGMLSPSSYAALHPLPRSISPTSPMSARPYSPERPRVDSISPQDTSLSPPMWASNLWEPSGTIRPRPTGRMSESTIRPRAISYRGSVSTGHVFTSSSAPSHSAMPGMARSYSRRSESISMADDNDATIRRKKRSPPLEDDMPPSVKSRDSPLKSVLRPPKLAPSAWQLYFTDWIQKQQASGTRKLNVAQAAKEAGQEYALLTNEQKEPYKRKSQAMKEARERDLAAYLRTLTPDDIRRENAYRTQQRKEGKSRKSNIKDPNAPKKPLSAYFMFLQRIRANPHLVRDIFGDETETTKQSVLAAAKWRSMSDAERQPYLAQAEQEKMEYEAARRIYEEGHAGYSSSNINFSILPSSPLFQTLKMESESESEGSGDDPSGRH